MDTKLLDLGTMLPVQDAAALVGKTRQTIYNLIRANAIGYAEIASVKLVNKNDLIRIALQRGWIKRKEVEGG